MINVPANATSITSGDITDKRPFARLQSPLRGNPAGRMFSTGQTVVSPNTGVPITSMSESYVTGGMTFSSSSNELIVPFSGFYLITGWIIWQNDGGPVGPGIYATQFLVGGGVTSQFNTPVTASIGFPGSGGSDILPLAASGTIALQGFQTSTAKDRSYRKYAAERNPALRVNQWTISQFVP
jgi:hypothetical protein